MLAVHACQARAGNTTIVRATDYGRTELPDHLGADSRTTISVWLPRGGAEYVKKYVKRIELANQGSK